MNIKELKNKCKELKIKNFSNKNKKQLIDLIQKYENTIKTNSDNQNIIEIDWI